MAKKAKGAKKKAAKKRWSGMGTSRPERTTYDSGWSHTDHDPPPPPPNTKVRKAR
jgi:hypothetical protein